MLRKDFNDQILEQKKNIMRLPKKLLNVILKANQY